MSGTQQFICVMTGIISMAYVLSAYLRGMK